MSPAYISAALRRKVSLRAGSRCEYCLLSEDDAYFSHEPDHIIAEKHGGRTTKLTCRGDQRVRER